MKVLRNPRRKITQKRKKKPKNHKRAKKTRKNVKLTEDQLKKQKLLKWLKNRGNKQMADILKLIFSLYFALDIYPIELEEVTRRPELLTNFVERRSFLKRIFQSIRNSVGSNKAKILYTATMLRIMRNLSHEMTSWSYFSPITFEIEKFWLGITWTEGQLNEVENLGTQQDHSELMIIFIEFLLAKRSNFEDSISPLLKQFCPYVCSDKIMASGVQSNNGTTPKMTIKFYVHGDSLLITKFRSKTRYCLTNFLKQNTNWREQNFDASVCIECQQLRNVKVLERQNRFYFKLL